MIRRVNLHIDEETLSTVVAARPGCRLWRADPDGQVLETMQFRSILEDEHDDEEDDNEDNSLQLAHLQSEEVLRVPKEIKHSFSGGKVTAVTLNGRTLLAIHGSSAVYIVQASFHNIR